MIRPNATVFRAALAGVRAAGLARADALRATCSGNPEVAAWLGRQADRWDEYVAAIADESIAEATRFVAGDAACQRVVTQPVTQAVQSGTNRP